MMHHLNQKDILLVTLNSTYHHSAFGLRYIYANLKEFQKQAIIIEFTISKDFKEIAEQLLAYQPQIIGLGVYIWNTRQTLDLISLIKQINPKITIVLGGPEVSFESESQEICQRADHVIKGEADFLFHEFCTHFFNKKPFIPKYISGPLPDIQKLNLPYTYYNDEDIKNRIIYVEASRGCPFKCEYCLSSLDKSVRGFDVEILLNELTLLLQRGVRQFKFIDRTFNLNPSICLQILNFFYEHISLGLFLHFEMVPDRLPSEIKNILKKFPAGSLQFEIGVQTMNPQVAQLVSRRNDYKKMQENLQYLREETGVHSHADLIVGLPGESLNSFADGFDQLAKMQPDEIQVGILKRLRGTPIVRHDKEWEMVYQTQAPYSVLKTKDISFKEMQQMNRFAKYWDLYANSGNFKNLMKLMLQQALKRNSPSFFWLFYEFTEFLSKRHPQSYGIALINLTESAWIYLCEELKIEHELARQTLIQDYSYDGRRDIPSFLKTGQIGRAHV